jgi:hypothetical protein
LEGVKMSMLANKLNSRPIEGIDFPMNNNSADNEYGVGQLLEVENIESLNNEITNEQ